MKTLNRNAGGIRQCRPEDHAELLRIINAAAEAYRDVIPVDRWHEPYMRSDELAAELAAGVVFSCHETAGGLTGIMGVQHRNNVDLIRHAYVLPARQGHGIGSALIEHLRRDQGRPLLVGTWQAAEWAIRFYERRGFARVAEDISGQLLRTYWTVPERQIAASVVLSSPALKDAEAAQLMAQASVGNHPPHRTGGPDL